MARHELDAPPPSLKAGGLEIDLAAYRVRYFGQDLGASRSQVELLGMLVANRRRVLSRTELSDALGLARSRSVDVILTSLRHLLGRDFVRNVRGRGWILVSDESDA